MRRSLRVALLAASLVAAGIPGATAAPATVSDKATFVRQAIDTHFVPRIDAFARTTGPLLQSIDAMCNAPGRETLAAARRAFVTSLLAWENASAIAYGPIATRRSIYKIDFWPVRVNLIMPLLQNPPTTVAELEAVGGPAKGYPTLEWVLWTPAEDPSVLHDANRCAYSRVVAMDIANEAQALVKDFAAYAAQPISPDTADERFSELLGLMLGALEKLGVRKIEKPSYVGAGKNFPRKLSDQTVAEWNAQWASLRSLFIGDGTAGGASIEALLRAHGHRALADRVRAAVNRVSSTLAGARATPAVGQKAGKDLSDLRKLYSENVAAALKITIEFDENDGD